MKWRWPRPAVRVPIQVKLWNTSGAEPRLEHTTNLLTGDTYTLKFYGPDGEPSEWMLEVLA